MPNKILRLFFWHCIRFALPLPRRKQIAQMIRKFDFLVIGSGVAGMSYALQVAASGKGKVALVCKTTLEEANTAKAQGGIASVTNF